MITLHPNMKEKYEGTCFGVLVLRDFRETGNGREAFRAFVAEELAKVRQRHPDYDRKRFCTTDPVASPYVQYYKKFKKTFHVLHQIESVLAGKTVPDAMPLVQALFLTEIATSLLIAGHDLKTAVSPFSIEMSRGGEAYTGTDGRDIVLKPDDICMRDGENFILSIIYGQDERTRITERTTDVLYLIDGVPGLEESHVKQGLDTLLACVRVFNPEIDPELMAVLRV